MSVLLQLAVHPQAQVDVLRVGDLRRRDARLKSLESRGWITRTAHPGDRRQVVVSLTVPGRELFDRVFDDVLGCQRTLIAGLDDGEADRLSDTFRRLLVRLEPETR